MGADNHAEAADLISIRRGFSQFEPFFSPEILFYFPWLLEEQV